MSKELWDELFATVCAKRMNVNTSLGKQRDLTDALLEVVERRLESVRQEAHDSAVAGHRAGLPVSEEAYKVFRGGAEDE